MKLNESIAKIAGSHTQAGLVRALSDIVHSYGFDSFCFADTGTPHLDMPFFIHTASDAWRRDYESNGFIHVDVHLQKARRSNIAFNWASVALPQQNGRRKPGAIKLMEAATDHGFREGLIIPLHFADEIGRIHSSLCTLYWTEDAFDFYRTEMLLKQEINLILIYWMQTFINFRKKSTVIPGFQRPHLTDRERHVIEWAARGKTASETADILLISSETVDTHIRNAVGKLDASNKTHAVAKAILLGAIDM